MLKLQKKKLSKAQRPKKPHVCGPISSHRAIISATPGYYYSVRSRELGVKTPTP